MRVWGYVALGGLPETVRQKQGQLAPSVAYTGADADCGRALKMHLHPPAANPLKGDTELTFE